MLPLSPFALAFFAAAILCPLVSSEKEAECVGDHCSPQIVTMTCTVTSTCIATTTMYEAITMTVTNTMTSLAISCPTACPDGDQGDDEAKAPCVSAPAASGSPSDGGMQDASQEPSYDEDQGEEPTETGALAAEAGANEQFFPGCNRRCLFWGPGGFCRRWNTRCRCRNWWGGRCLRWRRMRRRCLGWGDFGCRRWRWF